MEKSPPRRFTPVFILVAIAMAHTASAGLNWSEVSPPETAEITRVRYINSHWWITASKGTLFSSTDATHWQTVHIGTQSTVNEIAWFPYGSYLVGTDATAGSDDSRNLYSSPDGQEWTAQISYQYGRREVNVQVIGRMRSDQGTVVAGNVVDQSRWPRVWGDDLWNGFDWDGGPGWGGGKGIQGEPDDINPNPITEIYMDGLGPVVIGPGIFQEDNVHHDLRHKYWMMAFPATSGGRVLNLQAIGLIGKQLIASGRGMRVTADRLDRVWTMETLDRPRVGDDLRSASVEPFGFAANLFFGKAPHSGGTWDILASRDGLHWYDTHSPVAEEPKRIAASSDKLVMVGASRIYVAPITPTTIVAQSDDCYSGTGDSATLSVLLPFDPNQAATFQWYRDGRLTAAGNDPTFTISGLAANTPRFEVTVTASVQGVSIQAVPIAVAHNPSRLVNLSSRASLGDGDQPLVVGFVVDGSDPARTGHALIRGVGPALGTFGVTGFAPDPRLELFSGNASIGFNDDWGSASGSAPTDFDRVGAFGLPTGSADAALSINNLAAGAYTVHAKAAPGAAGIGLVEFYDMDSTDGIATAPLINLSIRAPTGEGEAVLVVGFVIRGDSPLKVLLRGIGPTLRGFGVSDAISDARIRLFDQSGSLVDENDNWSDRANAGETATAASRVGAFPLPNPSGDAAMLLSLAPGSYTLHVGSPTDEPGTALAELYVVPDSL